MALTMIRCVLSVIKDGWDWKKSALQITVWLLGMLPGIFCSGWSGRRKVRSDWEMAAFSDHWVLSGGWRTLEL
ncbi:MAG: hypothetical protein ACLR8P_04535 [Clostridium fessum]